MHTDPDARIGLDAAFLQVVSKAIRSRVKLFVRERSIVPNEGHGCWRIRYLLFEQFLNAVV